MKINARGNILYIVGQEANRARSVLINLIEMVKEKIIVDNEEVDAAIRLSISNDFNKANSSYIKTPKKKIIARSATQKKYIESLKTNTLTFGIGPAGTGKT